VSRSVFSALCSRFCVFMRLPIRTRCFNPRCQLADKRGQNLDRAGIVIGHILDLFHHLFLELDPVRRREQFFTAGNQQSQIGSQQVGNLPQQVQRGVTADLNDVANETTLQTLGTIRVNASQRESDISQLEAASHSLDPSQQTELATLQRINQALLLELRTQQETNEMNQPRVCSSSLVRSSNRTH
jgi:hypothetical protein